MTADRITDWASPILEQLEDRYLSLRKLGWTKDAALKACLESTTAGHGTLATFERHLPGLEMIVEFEVTGKGGAR